jgi:hypothetical protein
MSRDYSQIVSEGTLNNAVQRLETNGFTVEVVDNLPAAHTKVLDLIPEGSEVFTATSVTLDKAELTAALNDSGKYVSVRDKFMPLYGQEDKAVEMRRLGSASDYTVGSVHAVTEDGQVLVASATGSQLPNYAYGASHVIWVVGTQKIVKDLSEAMERLENYVFPLENERATKAYGSGSVISKLLIYRKDPVQRVTLVLVKEAAGF